MGKRELKFKVQFKNKIREYRESRGVTREELAIATGRSVDSIYQMEGKKVFPRSETREKIMEFLGASFNDLFYEEKKE